MRRIGNVVAVGLVVLGLLSAVPGGSSVVLDFSIPDITSSSQGNEGGTDIVTDSLGFLYLVGHSGDGFVAKYDGSKQVWFRSIGAISGSLASAIALDSFGNVYVTGRVPPGKVIEILNGFDTTGPGVNAADAYLVKFDPDGQLLYGTYIGGSGEDEGWGVTVDSTGAAVVVGFTSSDDFPNVPPTGVTENHGFLVRIDTSLQGVASLLYSAKFGGNPTNAWRVASDGAGGVWVVGDAGHTSLWPACGIVCSGCSEPVAFSLHFPPNYVAGCPIYPFTSSGSGSSAGRVTYDPSRDQVWSTGYSAATSCSADRNAFISGPLTGCIGGTGIEEGRGIAIDPVNGDVWVMGTTQSSNFPVTCVSCQQANGGDWDAFVARFVRGSGLTPDFSTYLGGQYVEIDLVSTRYGGIAIDPWGGAFVTGSSGYKDFPCVGSQGSLPSCSGSTGPGGTFLARYCDPQVCTTPTIKTTCLAGNSVKFDATYLDGNARGPWRWSFFRGNPPVTPSNAVCYGANQPANCVGSARGQSATFTFPEGTDGFTARLESCCQKFTDFPVGIGVAIALVSPAYGSVGTSITITGTGFTGASTVFVSTPACKTMGGTIIEYPAVITASNLATYPQTLTFTFPSEICANPGGYDVTVKSNNPPPCAEPTQATAYNAFILAAPGRSTLSRTFGSTSGGTQIHVYNGGTCDYTNTTVLTFGSVDCTVSTDTALPCRMTLISGNDLLVTTPSVLEGAPVTMSMTGGGCAFLAPDNEFEFVQFGFSTDKSANANTMALFRSGNNPTGHPLASDERHSIDGRPFPSIPVSAISDVDLVAQSNRKLLVVEPGRTVRLWSVGSESFTQSYPPTATCPPLSYWSPKRVAVDPDGTIAYVLHRQTTPQLCPAIVPEAPAPINLLEVKSGGISLYDRADTGSGITDSEIVTTNTFGNSGFPVDAGARVTALTGNCPSTPFDGLTFPHKWQNAGYVDGLTQPPATYPFTPTTGSVWKSRYLVVTQSSLASDQALECPLPTIPPLCTPGEVIPRGCKSNCKRCIQPPCPALFLPLVLAVYDLNPFIAKSCTGSNPPTVTIQGTNPHYLQKRAVVFLDQFLGAALPNGTHYEIGLSLSGSSTDDLLVAAPLSGKLLSTTLSNALTLGDQQRSLYNDQSLEGDLTLPSSSFIDLVAGDPGSLPTSIVVMNEKTTGNDFAYITLAGTNPNQIQKRFASNPATVDAVGILNDSAGSPGLVFPTALAGREQGDKVFTANFVDGSISPIPGNTAQMTGSSVPVGTLVQRIAIQSESCASCLTKTAEGELSDAAPSEFDLPPHQMALLKLIRALERVVDRKQASPSAVDAQVRVALDRIDHWIVDQDLASNVKSDLVNVGSLYRQGVTAGP